MTDVLACGTADGEGGTCLRRTPARGASRTAHDSPPQRADGGDLFPLARATRLAHKERTRRRVAKVPGPAVTATALTCNLAASTSLLLVWGMREVVLFQLATLAASAYAASNDIRKSVIGRVAWRNRHGAIARLVRRHPLD
ncbi:hypothetical protein ABT160_21930 [Streptomyces sp. NPDC001941]|uniref:hypothetical protein n=1 Tax=Streptomyces sp. NPDC001941 TaxID=3154659 RepID=UPI00331E2678